MALWNMELGDGLPNLEILHSITHGENSVSIFVYFLYTFGTLAACKRLVRVPAHGEMPCPLRRQPKRQSRTEYKSQLLPKRNGLCAERDRQQSEGFYDESIGVILGSFQDESQSESQNRSTETREAEDNGP
jgi:hypothetical protein